VPLAGRLNGLDFDHEIGDDAFFVSLMNSYQTARRHIPEDILLVTAMTASKKHHRAEE
jgi:hypothetical protein